MAFSVVPSDAPSSLSRFEKLPPEIRHEVYSYLGYPIGAHIFAQCGEPSTRFSRTFSWTSRGRAYYRDRHVIPHLKKHCGQATGTFAPGPLERMVRILGIVLVGEAIHFEKSTLPALCVLDGYPGLVELVFSTIPLKINKFIRDDILAVFSRSIPVTLDFTFRLIPPPGDLSHIVVISHLTSVTLTCDTSICSGSVSTSVRRVRYVSKHATSLQHFTFTLVPSAVLHSRLMRLGLNAAIGSLAENPILKTVSIRTRRTPPSSDRDSRRRAYSVQYPGDYDWRGVLGLAKQRKTWLVAERPGFSGTTESINVSVSIQLPEVDETIKIYELKIKDGQSKKDLVTRWSVEQLKKFKPLRGLINIRKYSTDQVVTIPFESGRG